MTSTADSGPPPDVHPLLERAMAAHQANRAAEARQAYEQLLAEQPDHPDAHHLLGLLNIGQRRIDEGLRLILRAVELNPREPMYRNNLGNLYQQLDRLDDAEQQYVAALELDPTRLDVLNNVALLQGRRGDFESATRTLARLVDIAPKFADARQNLVGLYLRAGKVHDAIRECSLGLITEPRHRGLRRMLGIAYSTMGYTEQAAEVYRKWLEDEPDNANAAHHLAAVTGENVPARASERYVRETFDGFASSFDEKLAFLGYQAPMLVAGAVQRRFGEGERRLRVADAGCGTGLCAPLLAPFAASLVGVDLSPAMLALAHKRGGYDALFEGDLVSFLGERPAAFDLLVSADTLCYFGDIDEFATAARGSVVAGGLLVFTVEAHPDDEGVPDFRLHHHGRYSHRLGYLRRALTEAGFARVEARAVVLRHENQLPVQGWLVEAE